MVIPAPRSPSEPVLLVTVDTEEDQWGPSGGGYTAENIRLLPVLHGAFRSMGVRPTYFTTHEVAACPTAAAILTNLAEMEEADVQAHLHPWNTPPFRESAERRNTMLSNLPYELQEAKLRVLTESLTRAFGRRPTAFRAGRLGFGVTTPDALIACGYDVDCSTSPFTDFTDMDEGPDFTSAPLQVHRVGRGGARLPPGSAGIMEIPLSVGFTRRPFALWSSVHRACEKVRLGSLPVTALLSRSGIIRKVALQPEQDDARDMIRVALTLLRSGVGHLQLLLHSPTMVPGLTPFTRSRQDVQRMLGSIEELVTELRRHVRLRVATVREFADEQRTNGWKGARLPITLPERE